MPADTLTVSELAQEIQAALDRLGGERWVQGELHGLRRTERGHVWFELVEPGPVGGPPVAVLPVVLFDRHRRGVNAILRRTGGVRMTDGMAIRIRAAVELYPPHGRLRLVMTGIDPEYTLGTLLAERDRVLEALRRDGLLHRNGSIPAAPLPLRVGLVTAAGSAAYADFVHELERSRHAFRVVHVDARVQGAGAERTLVAALRTLRRHQVDVVALVRGGGARTDLACFDGEQVARAIAAMTVPVHTGIGHETDRSVADEVAHTAHKTPTACAAALVGAVDDFLTDLRHRAGAIAAASRQRLDREAAHLRGQASRTARSGDHALDRAQGHLVQRADRARRAAHHALGARTAHADRAATEVARRATNALARAERQLDGNEAHARAADPARLLARGWSITRTADGVPARAGDVGPGTALVTKVADGEIHSVVTGTEADAR